MDVRIIVLLGGTGEASRFGAPVGTVAGAPAALLDVLGRSVLDRVLERLERVGPRAVTVVGEMETKSGVLSPLPQRASTRYLQVPAAELWRAGERVLNDSVRSGAETLLVVRLGPYAEIDYEEMVQFHLERHARVTAAITREGWPLDAFVANASRRNDLAFLLRHQLQNSREPWLGYSFAGYVNRLEDAGDLRQLALDAFAGAAQVQPTGRELRPGVWVEQGARIQRGARILAPAFVGRWAKIRSATVITRGSVLEQRSEVDCGTVVENATLLPYTYVGAGLDVSHAVVGNRRLVHLRRQVEVEIDDATLVKSVSRHAPLRAARQALALAAFLPMQFVRGLFATSHRERSVPLPASLAPAREAPASLAVASPDPGRAPFPQ